MNPSDYKTMVLRAIERTNNNPIAPIALQQFMNGCNNWAKVLAATTNQEELMKIVDRLLKDFSKEEQETISKSPAFICALIGMAKTSTIDFLKP